MHYVYLTDNIVTDQAQIDPFKVFAPSYAVQFIEAPDEVTFGWTYKNGEFSPPPGPTPEQIQAQNKQEAITKLQATDWAATVDITDQNFSDPYLGNQGDFLLYRSAVRKIAVNPPTTKMIEWPAVPDAVWLPVQVVL